MGEGELKSTSGRDPLGFDDENLHDLFQKLLSRDKKDVSSEEDVITRLSNEQPELFEYLNQASELSTDPTSFMEGVAFAYEVIPPKHAQERLSEDAMVVFEKTISDHPMTNDKGELGVDFSWLTEKIQKDFPHLVNIIKKSNSGSDRDIAFEYGFWLTVAPFDQRAEARRLDNQFFPPPLSPTKK